MYGRNRKREGRHDRERKREGVNKSRSLTHLVGQEHKSQCLPGLQWSMKPPVECNRRSLEPPYRPLTGQPPTGSLKGEQADKERRLLRPALLPGAGTPTKETRGSSLKSPQFDAAFDLRRSKPYLMRGDVRAFRARIWTWPNILHLMSH